MLEIWIQTPLAQALGAALLHSIWQGGAAAAALAGLLYWARPASARVRHDAACLLLMAVTAGFLMTFAVCYPESSGGAQVTLVSIGAGSAGVAEAGAAASQPWVQRLAELSPRLAPWWALGVLLLSMRQLVGWLGMRRLRAAGVATADGWRRRVEELCGQMGVTIPVELAESARVESPVVLGAFKPLILLPLGMLTSTPAVHVELILLHELAHVRRRDYAINLLRRVVESLFFYHPAVWWMSSVVAAEREQCCDDLVVQVTGDAHSYAAALVGLETFRGAPQPALGVAGGSLLYRVRRLLGREEGTGRSTPVAAIGLALAMGLLISGWMTQSTAQQSEEMTAHQKWLAFDVVYIIQPEERIAFEALESDPDRDRFMEQFWERRDPTPGTPANEAKEEHYRRIAYVNDRFAGGSLAGWQTDTGRIYITVGPPDEIEAYPSGGGPEGATLPPWQTWRYRGDGAPTDYVFVDTDADGAYELMRRTP